MLQSSTYGQLAFNDLADCTCLILLFLDAIRSVPEAFPPRLHLSASQYCQESRRDTQSSLYRSGPFLVPDTAHTARNQRIIFRGVSLVINGMKFKPVFVCCSERRQGWRREQDQCRRRAIDVQQIRDCEGLERGQRVTSLPVPQRRRRDSGARMKF